MSPAFKLGQKMQIKEAISMLPHLAKRIAAKAAPAASAAASAAAPAARTGFIERLGGKVGRGIEWMDPQVAAYLQQRLGNKALGGLSLGIPAGLYVMGGGGQPQEEPDPFNVPLPALTANQQFGPY